MSVAMLFIPESPRWLIQQGRYEDGRKALEWLRPKNSSIESELAEIRAAISHEKELGSGVGIADIFRNPVDRRRSFLSICSVLLQAASGSMFIIAYKAYFFKMANVQDPFAMTNVLSATGLLAIIINSLIVVRFGRRRVLLMGGFALCGILQLILAITYDKNPGAEATGKVLVALSCLYIMAYNVSSSTYLTICSR